MEKTKFGYKEIDQKDKPSKVNQVFTSVSNRYDLMNDIMSFGLHRFWKKQFLRLCNLSNKKNILDVACGTGDIALAIKKQKNSINLTCLDPNKEMIEICKQKFLNSGITDIIYENSGIEDFKLLKNKYDLVTLAFGFRNFTNHEKGLRNIYDCLEPGGLFLLMDFKKPSNEIYSKLFKNYTLKIIPKIGQIVADDFESYKYLGESIQTYFSPDQIEEMCLEVGFECTKIVNLLEDVATIHIARKL